MAKHQVLLPAGSMEAIAKADKKRGALPLNAVKGKPYIVTPERLREMAEAENWSGIRSLRNISPDGEIYTKYKCIADTTEPDKCFVIRRPEKDDLYLPKFEAITTSDILVIKDQAEQPILTT